MGMICSFLQCIGCSKYLLATAAASAHRPWTYPRRVQLFFGNAQLIAATHLITIA
jgi:hypothetical protein